MLIYRLEKIDNDDNNFPFCIPSFQKLATLDLDNKVNIFVGENGSGKSTLLEIIAIKLGLHRISSDIYYNDLEFIEIKKTLKAFKLYHTTKPKGFFFRSEDFITYIDFLQKAKKNTYEDLKLLKEESIVKNNPHLYHYGAGAFAKTINEIDSMYEKELYDESHGESYLDFFKSRIRSNSLYVLDEAEMPLSIQNQLALLAIIEEATSMNCQFIISTHSPILMSYPHANIYQIDNNGFTKIQYQDIESVRLLKDFLNHPDSYLRRLFNKE